MGAKIEDGLAQQIDLSELHGSISNGSDTLVLACTHYIGIKDHLQKAYPAVAILEPLRGYCGASDAAAATAFALGLG